MVHTPSLVHSLHLYSLVPAPPHTPISTYGTSDPSSPSHDSSAESVTSTGNPTSRNNPPNPVPDVAADPNSYPSLPDSYSLDSYDSSDNGYATWWRHTKNKRKGNVRVKTF